MGAFTKKRNYRGDDYYSLDFDKKCMVNVSTFKVEEHLYSLMVYMATKKNINLFEYKVDGVPVITHPLFIGHTYTKNINAFIRSEMLNKYNVSDIKDLPQQVTRDLFFGFIKNIDKINASGEDGSISVYEFNNGMSKYASELI